MTASTNTETLDGLLASGADLDLVDLSCVFGDVTAVDAINLRVAAGEFVSLLGPSGSGKTTTLMMIAGFQEPTAGRIVVGGHDMSTVAAHKRDIGVVFQSYALFPHMTVFENVAYPLRARKTARSQIEDRVRRVLDLVRLPAAEYGDRRPAALSGGQQQRVAMARALVYEPRILLMDEPMGALDKNLRAELQLELKALHDRVGVTILYVTHDQDEAMSMSDRVALFCAGRIEQLDTPRRLYEAPKTAFAARFLGDANLLRLDAGLVMVRPERIRLVPPAEGRLQGQVRQHAYLGATIRAAIDTAIGPVVVKAGSVDVTRLMNDDHVGLQWPDDAAVVVEP